MHELAGADLRPLMLMLDLEKPNKKVDALLQGALKSERFQLASKWFHCIKMDGSVLEKGHAYHSLFEGRRPGRLVLVSRDGSKLVSFLGSAQSKVNWSGVASVLKVDYRKDPTKAVKSIERMLSKFDALDAKRKEINAQLERATKKNQKSKIKAIEKKLAANEKARTKALAEQKKLEDIGLRAADKKAKKAG